MNLLAPISTIMSTNLITVSPEDNMHRVEELFRNNHIHHLPVVKNDELVGIVSKTDFLFFKRGFNNQNEDERLDLFRLKVWKVSNVMTKGLAKMFPNDRINVALDIFSKNLFHAILVVEGKELKGIVTTLDIIKRLADDNEAINKY